jgi:ubiquinone/menaquinone biosynthesis C-methylase UbiE
VARFVDPSTPTDVVESPNIWRWPAVYEAENAAQDATGTLWATVCSLAPHDDADVVDVGCGDGHHLPRFAERARSVVGVEPHLPLVERARRRCAADPRVTVLPGSAARLPLDDASADVVHARTAYFFGPGCEPGLAELGRVVRRGGAAFVIDNDATRSTFGSWFRRWLPSYDPVAVERFWSRQGFSRTPVDMGWRFRTRADLEAVLRIEFPAPLASEFLASIEGCEVDYAVNLWWRRH